MNTVQQIAIVTKYLPPTNTKASRIKLSLPRWENKSIVFSYHMEGLEGNNTHEMAECFLRLHNINPIALLDMGGFYVITASFKEIDAIRKLFKISKLYYLRFTGRVKNAIGIMEDFEEKIEAISLEDARLKLYDEYQDILNLREL